MGDAGLLAGLLGAEDRDDKCCELTFANRLIATAICSGLSTFLAIIACIKIAQRDLGSFAVIFTLSIIASIGASFFVAGPKKHWARLKESRAHLLSAIGVAVFIVLVFVVAFATERTGATLLAFLLELVCVAFFYLTLYATVWTIFKGLVGHFCHC